MLRGKIFNLGNFPIFLIIILAFVLRVYNFDFPNLTIEEARLASRAPLIATQGIDELGRKFPLVFNSLDDYKFPLPSYLTAVGVKVFGYNEVGVRVPFVLAGTLLIYLIYVAGFLLSKNRTFALTAALLGALSPTLIFLSKTPNSLIVLVLLFLALFCAFLVRKLRIWLVLVIGVLIIMTSKYSLAVLVPFSALTLLFLRPTLFPKERRFQSGSLMIVGAFALITVAAFLMFLSIPDSIRSIKENNLSVLSNLTIKNGIERMRSQGVDAGWNPTIERLLFNKVQYVLIGILHWLSQLMPLKIFGQFDETGLYSFSRLGVFPKVLIIPFLLGLAAIFTKKNLKDLLVIFILLVVTFPAILIFPQINFEGLVLTIPFFIFIVTSGLINTKKLFSFVILLIAVLELSVNLVFVKPEKVNVASVRPLWIKILATDTYIDKKNMDVVISDNLSEDIVPLYSWYSRVPQVYSYEKSNDYPYRFHVTELPKLKLVGNDEKFILCSQPENQKYFFLSDRDLKKNGELKWLKTYDEFYNDKGDVKVTAFTSGLCP